MANKNIKYVITTDSSQAEKGFDRVNQKAESLTASLGKVAGAIGLAFGTREILSFIKDSVVLNAQFEELSSYFKSGTEQLELFRKATSGTVTDGNLIKLSNYASDLGLSLRDQAIAFNMADEAGDKYGTTIEEGFNKIIIASSGSARARRALGLSEEQYNKSLKEVLKDSGLRINQLALETQQQVRLQAIIRSSGMDLDDINKKQRSNIDQIEGLSVKYDDLQKSIGKAFEPLLINLLPKITAFFDQWINNIKNTDKAIRELSDNPFWSKVELFIDYLNVPKQMGGDNKRFQVPKEYLDFVRESQKRGESFFDITKVLDIPNAPAPRSVKTSDELKLVDEALTKINENISNATGLLPKYTAQLELLKYQQEHTWDVGKIEIYNKKIKDLTDRITSLKYIKGMDLAITNDALSQGSKWISDQETKNRLLLEEAQRRFDLIEIKKSEASYEDPLAKASKWMDDKYGGLGNKRIDEISRLTEEEKYKRLLDDTQNIGSALQNIFGQAGDTFIGKLNEALSIVQSIVTIMEAVSDIKGILSALGILSSIPTGGVSLTAPELPGLIGGSFLKDLKLNKVEDSLKLNKEENSFSKSFNDIQIPKIDIAPLNDFISRINLIDSRKEINPINNFIPQNKPMQPVNTGTIILQVGDSMVAKIVDNKFVTIYDDKVSKRYIKA